MTTRLLQLVTPIRLQPSGGGRMGTCRATRQQAEEVLGPPTWTWPPGQKVTFSWTFATPRGLAELRDYWWNADDELSVAATSYRAARWLGWYLRVHGLRATP